MPFIFCSLSNSIKLGFVRDASDKTKNYFNVNDYEIDTMGKNGSTSGEVSKIGFTSEEECDGGIIFWI